MTPASTYRIQLHAGFTLDDATSIVDYLARLGVGALYLAPVWRAVPGSQHGYDVLEPDRVSDELGGVAALERLAAAAHERQLGVVADVVPNHQAADVRNPRWRSVLAEGTSSPYAAWFDIDWTGNDGVPPGKVMLPVLGEPAAEALRSGALRFEAADAETDGVTGSESSVFDYHGVRYPVRGPVSPAARAGAHDALAALLDEQAYVLGEWRTSERFRNYRRFFDIDALVGVRVEDPAVFQATHALVFDLAHRGVIDGVRLDHIDGLADPDEYLRRLAAALPDDTWIIVEKILAADEHLPAWPVAGTTGYEWGGALHEVQVDETGRELLAAGAAAEGIETDFARVEHECKELVLDSSFGAEWDGVCARVPRHLHGALRALTLSLDVYRTYLVPPEPPSPEDRVRLERAVRHAAARGGLPGGRAELDAVVELLLTDPDLARRWQQLTGPLMAKGHEDTACYRYPVLISQCEVGADPGADLHDALDRLVRRASVLPEHARGQATTATHDSKRGEDVRARLAALSEVAAGFEAAMQAWRRSGSIPDGVTPDEQRFVAQTILGTWPHRSPVTARAGDGRAQYADRIADYLRKALREAKLRTSWLDPDEQHEASVIKYACESVHDDSDFARAFAAVRTVIEPAGASNSLAQLLLKVALPAVPDIYRGCETWDLSLVDPDNRRPVDHAALAAALADLTDVDWETRRERWADGTIKLAATERLLRARRTRTELFTHGSVARVDTEGVHRHHVIAIRRALDDAEAVAVATRHPATLTPGDWPIGARWAGTTLTASGAWTDALTGATLVADDQGRLRLADVFRRLPVALLIRS